MSLSSSLNAGVAGLTVNSMRLATISDNIANSSTFGYRRVDVDFSSLVTGTQSDAFSAGGVRGDSFREVASAGSLINTGNSTDLAIGGRGMLPVTDANKVDLPSNERPFMLTPTGSFDTDERGFVVTKSGLGLLGFPTDASGNLSGAVVRDGTSSLEPVQVSPFITAAQQTTELSLGVNLPARETDAANIGTAFQSPIEYFDSIGRDNTLNIVYTSAAATPPSDPSNTWTLQIFDSATPGNANPATDPPLAELTLPFDDTNGGQLANPGTPVTGPSAGNYDPATGILSITASQGNVPIEVFIGSGDPNVTGGLTQLDAEFAPTNVTKDGAPAGTLSGLEVDAKGILKGVYDTGQRVAFFQIPIGNVPNLNGLEALDAQAFALTPESGNVFLHDANTGPVGTIESSALQQSAVDIARELTDLIQTQRAYSSNATVVQTVDEMLQETTNIKR